MKLLSYALISFFVCLSASSHDLLKSNNYKKIVFSKIAQTSFDFSSAGELRVSVRNSNSPLIFPFKKKLIKGIKFQLSSSALLNLKDTQQSGPEADDFLFKVGLITPGESTLSFFQRAVAPSWVVELDKLSAGQGVDKILFYNVVQQKELLGTSRVHPLSDLMIEKMQWLYNKPLEKKKFEITFKKPIAVIGAWISPDGDQTSSSYDLVIEHLELIE